jgi:hypothetical protein
MFKEAETAESDLLERETPLTIEEIADLRSEKTTIYSIPARSYEFEGHKFTICREPAVLDKIKSEERKKEIADLVKTKEPREVANSERLLVNVLIEQARIAKKFGVPETAMTRFVKLNYTETGDIMMNDSGQIYMEPLKRHIEILKKFGATDEDVITEISGNLFHETVHNKDGNESINETLLGGRKPLGEVTPITAQLSYYLEKGYKGPKGYNSDTVLAGLKKIQEEQVEGVVATLDYDVATSVSCELLLEQILINYPEFSDDMGSETSLDTCEQIIEKLSEAEKSRLIPCFKEAISQSCDKQKFDEVVNRLKTKNRKNKNV